MINAAKAYTYDGQNNLISLMGNQYNTSTFTYDANGDCLTKLNQTHTTQYYFHDTNLLFTKRNGQIDVRYLYDDGAVYCAVYNDIPYWYNTDIRTLLGKGELPKYMLDLMDFYKNAFNSAR